MGESVNEAVLIKWHKKDGEAVKADEPIAELETDKANVDVPAPAAGVLQRVVTEGTTVRIGQPIATVDPNGSPTAAAAPAGGKAPAAKSAATPAVSAATAAVPAAAQPSGEALREKLSPAAQRMVDEHKLNPAQITPSGPGGRITKEDVVNFMSAGQIPAPMASSSADAGNAEPPAAAKPVAARPAPASAEPAPARTSTADGAVRRVPMSKIRKRIAENLVRSQQTAAILTTFNEVDLSNVIELRKKYKEQFEKKHNVGLGFMSFFAKAVCTALKEWERVNGSIDGDDIVYHDYVHLGIAVSTDRGLAVPVIRNAHEMSMAKLEAEIKRLATATRDGKLNLTELSGGTFTITNGGVFGSLLATPIINPPQSAILGMHAIKERPVAVNGQVVVRPMMYVALSYDHRLIDGRESVSFLVRVKELLEDPQRLLLEV